MRNTLPQQLLCKGFLPAAKFPQVYCVRLIEDSELNMRCVPQCLPGASDQSSVGTGWRSTPEQYPRYCSEAVAAKALQHQVEGASARQRQCILEQLRGGALHSCQRRQHIKRLAEGFLQQAGGQPLCQLGHTLQDMHSTLRC